VCQVVAGLQPGCCSFSLGALEAVLTAAEQQAGEAEAARAELQQLQVSSSTVAPCYAATHVCLHLLAWE
jgi:hypothetical protein